MDLGVAYRWVESFFNSYREPNCQASATWDQFQHQRMYCMGLRAISAPIHDLSGLQNLSGSGSKLWVPMNHLNKTHHTNFIFNGFTVLDGHSFWPIPGPNKRFVHQNWNPKPKRCFPCPVIETPITLFPQFFWFQKLPTKKNRWCVLLWVSRRDETDDLARPRKAMMLGSSMMPSVHRQIPPNRVILKSVFKALLGGWLRPYVGQPDESRKKSKSSLHFFKKLVEKHLPASPSSKGNRPYYLSTARPRPELCWSSPRMNIQTEWDNMREHNIMIVYKNLHLPILVVG